MISCLKFLQHFGRHEWYNLNPDFQIKQLYVICTCWLCLHQYWTTPLSSIRNLLGSVLPLLVTLQFHFLDTLERNKQLLSYTTTMLVRNNEALLNYSNLKVSFLQVLSLLPRCLVPDGVHESNSVDTAINLVDLQYCYWSWSHLDHLLLL